MVVVPREHQKYSDYTRRHHHDALRGDRVWIYQAILVCSHARLLFLCVAVQGAEVNIARSLVDPRVCPRGLETFVNDDSCEREEQAIEARRMLAERPIALEKRLIHVFNVGQVWSYK